MADDNGRRFDLIMQGIGEIKTDVKAVDTKVDSMIPKIAVIEERHRECVRSDPFNAALEVKRMRKEGLWDAINAEKRKKVWRKAFVGVAASALAACAFGFIKLLQFIQSIAAQVGG